MRAHEFITEEQRLNELLPLVTGGARSVSRTLAKPITTQAKTAATKAVSIASKPPAPRRINNPNAKVGTQANTIGDNGSQQSQKNIPVAKTTTAQSPEKVKDQLLRPGSSIALPVDAKGTTANFSVTKVSGDEIEIDNPQSLKDPNQPKKLVYKKSDLKKSMTV